LNEPDASLERIDTVHRVLWNQGLMSLLLVIKENELAAYSLVRRPFVREADADEDPRFIETLMLVANALELRELIESAESGRYWFERDNYFDPANRVDAVLLSNLLQAFRELKGELGSDGAQALLMQTMFIAYLEDREIIGEEIFRDASSGNATTFATLLECEKPKLLESLFAWLRSAFNGNVFNAPCAFDIDDRAPPKVKKHHLKVLARFRHGREEMVTRQLRFWGYDFKFIPIALISAVYDRFLKEEAEKRSAEGAFYTPMFLADTVVDQVWNDLSERQRASGVFLDPACGSGIFLVRLFQRMVAHQCRIKNKKHATWRELSSIAERLHGGDINTAAVRVAAFSLYIALLENTYPPDLPALIKKGKLLPSLYRQTLRPAEDFFDTSDRPRYDAIIGNPPWKGRAGQVTTAQKWAKQLRLPDPAKDIAWGFAWKALKVVKPDGLVGLLLPAMGVLHNTSDESQAARRLLFRTARVRRIINFSDLCFQLFDGAQRPTAFVLYHKTTDESPYRFEYWTPKADLNLRLKRLLTLARTDRILLRSDLVEDDPFVFKRRLWTRSPDERLLQYLKSLPPLSDLICDYRTAKQRGVRRDTHWIIGQGFQPAYRDRVAAGKYVPKPTHLLRELPFLSAAKNLPVIALPTQSGDALDRAWLRDGVRRHGFVDGFIGPHIIIPQGVERAIGRVRATYSDQSFIFQDSLQAIAFPPHQADTAKVLTAVLNSRLAAWFYFHETANLGTDRAKVVQTDLLKLPFAQPASNSDRRDVAQAIVSQVDEALTRADETLLFTEAETLQSIDSLVYRYYGLDADDIALVEDSFEYIIPAMQPRRSAGMQRLWAQGNKQHREAYAATLCTALQEWFPVPIQASLAGKSTDLAIVKVSLAAEGAASTYHENTAPVGEVLRKIYTHLPQPLPGNVQVMPDLRFVIGSDMYLIKPMQLRHWLRSAALADAEQIGAEFQASAARGGHRGSADAHW
jgi:hypothetical protein